MFSYLHHVVMLSATCFSYRLPPPFKIHEWVCRTLGKGKDVHYEKDDKTLLALSKMKEMHEKAMEAAQQGIADCKKMTECYKAKGEHHGHLTASLGACFKTHLTALKISRPCEVSAATILQVFGNCAILETVKVSFQFGKTDSPGLLFGKVLQLVEVATE